MPIKRGLIVLFLLALLGAVLAVTGVFHQATLSLLLLTQDGQRLFHDEIASRLRLIKETNSAMATGGLILVGFLYGALHAVGPGHGKIIISSYLLAGKSCLKRGILVTFLSSMLQAVVAIALVFGLIVILGLTQGDAEKTAVKLEKIGFGLVILVGIVLLGRGAKELWQLSRSHSPKENCSCGHHHAPDPQRLDKVQDMASLVGMVLSIGLRPCSGAVLLLLFAGLVGVYGAGILATFAMAFGTALTTSLLAVVTVQSKGLALRLTQSSGDNLRFLHAGLGIAGGVLIILMGTAFFSATGLDTQTDGMAGATAHPLIRSLFQTR